MEEPRAAAELKSLGKIQSKDGPLNVIVKPSAPPKGVRDSGRQASGAEGQQFPRRGPRPFGDDDILMDEDPTQILTVRIGRRRVIRITILSSLSLSLPIASSGRALQDGHKISRSLKHV